MNSIAVRHQADVLRRKLAAAMVMAIVIAAVYGTASLQAAKGKAVTIVEERIDPNTATVASLMRLPGIGRVRAMDIVTQRPFSAAADLDRVRGIGPKTLEKIAPYLTFGNHEQKPETTDCTE